MIEMESNELKAWDFLWAITGSCHVGNTLLHHCVVFKCGLCNTMLPIVNRKLLFRSNSWSFRSLSTCLCGRDSSSCYKLGPFPSYYSHLLRIQPPYVCLRCRQTTRRSRVCFFDVSRQCPLGKWSYTSIFFSHSLFPSWGVSIPLYFPRQMRRFQSSKFSSVDLDRPAAATTFRRSITFGSVRGEMQFSHHDQF